MSYASLLPQFRIYLRSLNLFRKPSAQDEHSIRNQIISTRLYLSVLYIASTVFILYISLVKDKKTVFVQTPSIDTYDYLQTFNVTSLVCPCSQISLEYGVFIRLQPVYHPVCSSDFVSSEWINFLNDWNNNAGFAYVDFRVSGPLQFKLLQQLCSLAIRTVDDALRLFYTKQLVAGAVYSRRQLDVQAHLLIDQFISSTTDTFVLSLDLIRSTNQGNQLVSGLFTNYFVQAREDSNGLFSVPMVTNLYADSDVGETSRYCVCALETDCGQKAGIYDTTEYELNFTVAGMRTGCYIFETLLQSNFECLYDQACLDELQSIIIATNSEHYFTTPNMSKIFAPNTTVESILKRLMIEKWHPEVSFINYYNACRPLSCTYSLMNRHNIIYIVASILALCDGLTQSLRVIVPFTVKMIRRKRKGLPQYFFSHSYPFTVSL